MKDFNIRIIDLIAVTHKTVRDVSVEDDFIEGCGIDSLSFIKLVSDLEKEFNIILIDDQFSINKINTVNKLNEYINEKLG